jgi:hypothetical protein
VKGDHRDVKGVKMKMGEPKDDSMKGDCLEVVVVDRYVRSFTLSHRGNDYISRENS